MAQYRVETDGDRCKCSDTQNGVVIEWNRGQFNETQSVSFATEQPADAVRLAAIMRQIGDYLAANYNNLII